MPGSNFRPYVWLIIGLFLTGLGLAPACSGEALWRFGSTASLPDSNFRPYVWLIIGLFLTGLGLASTCSREALGRFGRTASRVEEPTKFWRLVAIDYLGGAFGIGYFLFEKFLAK